jgi:hypothetical protein
MGIEEVLMAPREDGGFLLPAAPDVDSYEFMVYGAELATQAIMKKAAKLGVSEVVQPYAATISLLRWMEEQLRVTAEWLAHGQASFSPGVMLVYREAIVGLRDGLELAGDVIPDAGALGPWLHPIYPRQASAASRVSGLLAALRTAQQARALALAQPPRPDALPIELSLLDRLAPVAATRFWASAAAQLAPNTLETATAQAATEMVDDALAQRSGWAPHEADVAAQALLSLWRQHALDLEHVVPRAVMAIACGLFGTIFEEA